MHSSTWESLHLTVAPVRTPAAGGAAAGGRVLQRTGAADTSIVVLIIHYPHLIIIVEARALARGYRQLSLKASGVTHVSARATYAYASRPITPSPHLLSPVHCEGAGSRARAIGGQVAPDRSRSPQIAPDRPRSLSTHACSGILVLALLQLLHTHASRRISRSRSPSPSLASPPFISLRSSYPGKHRSRRTVAPNFV